jgi:hypothetical protein
MRSRFVALGAAVIGPSSAFQPVGNATFDACQRRRLRGIRVSERVQSRYTGKE